MIEARGRGRGRRAPRRRAGLAQPRRPTCARASRRRSEPALRGYGIGAQILAALGIHDMILLSNTRHAPVGLSGLWPGDRRGALHRCAES